MHSHKLVKNPSKIHRPLLSAWQWDEKWAQSISFFSFIFIYIQLYTFLYLGCFIILRFVFCNITHRRSPQICLVLAIFKSYEVTWCSKLELRALSHFFVNVRLQLVIQIRFFLANQSAKLSWFDSLIEITRLNVF